MYSLRESISSGREVPRGANRCIKRCIAGLVLLLVVYGIYSIWNSSHGDTASIFKWYQQVRSKARSFRAYLEADSPGVAYSESKDASCNSPTDSPSFQLLRDEVDKLSQKNQLIEQKLAESQPKHQTFVDYQMRLYGFKSQHVALDDINEHLSSIAVSPNTVVDIDGHNVGYVAKAYNAIRMTDIADVFNNDDLRTTYRLVTDEYYTLIALHVRTALTLSALRISVPKVTL